MQARVDPDGSLVLTHDSIGLARFLFILGTIMVGVAAYDFFIGDRGTDRLLALSGGAATLLLAGLVVLEHAHVRINPLERTIDWKRRWAFQRRSGTLSFDEIDVVFPERPIGDEGIPSRRIVVRTKDGRSIPLTKGYATDSGDAILRMSERITAMLGPRAASAQNIVEAMVAAGRTIDAIKHLRETAGLSLEEAKRQLDAAARRR